MRPAPITLDVFNAAASAKAARDAEFRAMHRQPDAPPLPAEPDDGSAMLGWLGLASRLLARRRPAARARRAAG